MTQPREITARKLTVYVPVSCCLLTDSTGVNHCEHPPPAPLPLRYRIRSRWWSLRMRVGCWIAGVDFNREDY